MLSYVADALVILGVAIMSAGLIGFIRMPDVYTKVHASGKSVFLGVVSLCVAAFLTQGPAVQARVVLIAIFLLLTTPVASHAIAQAARISDERMETLSPFDESRPERRRDILHRAAASRERFRRGVPPRHGPSPES